MAGGRIVTDLLQALADGLVQGGLLALVALGFTLVWGVLDMINLAHGSLVLVGAYATWELVNHGVDPILAGVGSAAVLFLAGYVLQRAVLNLVARAPALLTLLMTFGVGMLITDGLVAVFSSDDRGVQTAFSLSSLTVGSVYVPSLRLVSLGLAVCGTAGLALLLGRTRAGKAIRAVGMDREAARLMGIRVRHVYALTFGVAAALAGVAGTMTAVVGTFSPAAADAYTLQSFVVAVVGGVGNVGGALAGGLLLGVLEALAGLYLPGTLVSAIAFAVLVAALIVRPQGLVGRAHYSGRLDS